MPARPIDARERELGLQQLDHLLRSPADAFSIHYALQQQLRRDRNPVTTPIAAVALYNLGTGQTHAFSIGSAADPQRAIRLLTGSPPVDLAAIGQQGLLDLEYSMLYEYNVFLDEHRACTFVHWYMRDDVFGFQALEERFRRLQAYQHEKLHGARSALAAAPYGYSARAPALPVAIAEDRKLDLARVLRRIYGGGPLSLHEIADRNGLRLPDLIPGEREPRLFERGEHVRLLSSTLTKARLLAAILLRASEGRLSLESAGPSAPGPRPVRVFISYRRDDTRAEARKLHLALSAEFGADNVFFDTDDILPGHDFVEFIERKIAECDVFLALIDQYWAGSPDGRGPNRLARHDDMVRHEIALALGRRGPTIPVIPVLVDGTPMPEPEVLPDNIQPLRRRQAFELRNSQFALDAGRLVEKIRESLRQASQTMVR